MSLDEGIRTRLDGLIAAHDVTLFMKGNRQQPQCGFSNTVVSILDTLIPDYQTVDVLSDQDIREGIKAYSSWPTIPQLYVKGDFIGGCDIIQELFQSGELAETLGIEILEVTDPVITISDAAASQLRTAVEQQGGPGRDLHLAVDARFQANLFIGPVDGSEIVVESNGITLRMDRASAARGNGIEMDVVDTPQGPGFKINNPNAPQVVQLSVEELKALIDSGESFEFMDVRTEDEFRTRHIPGAVLVPLQTLDDELSRIPNSGVPIAVVCEEGNRCVSACRLHACLTRRIKTWVPCLCVRARVPCRCRSS